MCYVKVGIVLNPHFLYLVDKERLCRIEQNDKINLCVVRSYSDVFLPVAH